MGLLCSKSKFPVSDKKEEETELRKKSSPQKNPSQGFEPGNNSYPQHKVPKRRSFSESASNTREPENVPSSSRDHTKGSMLDIAKESRERRRAERRASREHMAAGTLERSKRKKPSKKGSSRSRQEMIPSLEGVLQHPVRAGSEEVLPSQRTFRSRFGNIPRGSEGGGSFEQAMPRDAVVSSANGGRRKITDMSDDARSGALMPVIPADSEPQSRGSLALSDEFDPSTDGSDLDERKFSLRKKGSGSGAVNEGNKSPLKSPLGSGKLSGGGFVRSTSGSIVRATGGNIVRTTSGNIVKALDSIGNGLDSMGVNISNSLSGRLAIKNSSSHKMEIVGFEVANIVVRALNLRQSLLQGDMAELRTEVLASEGVRRLVSEDSYELWCIAADDKRGELRAIAVEVARLGFMCSEPHWRTLTHEFNMLGTVEETKAKLSAEEVEAELRNLEALAQATAELYHELNSLDSLRALYNRKAAEELLYPKANSSVPALKGELRAQEKAVRNLRRRSLWNKRFDSVVEKLAEVVVFLHSQIVEVFGTDVVKMGALMARPRPGPAELRKLGVCGLAPHYANIVNVIDNLALRPQAAPQIRENLWRLLPPGIRNQLKRRLLERKNLETESLDNIRAELEGTLDWLVSMAANTIRYAGDRRLQGHTELTLLQTLHHAELDRTEALLLDLLVGLQHLVLRTHQVAEVQGDGYRSPVPRSPIRAPVPVLLPTQVDAPSTVPAVVPVPSQGVLRSLSLDLSRPGSALDELGMDGESKHKGAGVGNWRSSARHSHKRTASWDGQLALGADDDDLGAEWQIVLPKGSSVDVLPAKEGHLAVGELAELVGGFSFREAPATETEQEQRQAIGENCPTTPSMQQAAAHDNSRAESPFDRGTESAHTSAPASASLLTSSSTLQLPMQRGTSLSMPVHRRSLSQTMQAHKRLLELLLPEERQRLAEHQEGVVTWPNTAERGISRSMDFISSTTTPPKGSGGVRNGGSGGRLRAYTSPQSSDAAQPLPAVFSRSHDFLLGRISPRLPAGLGATTPSRALSRSNTFSMGDHGATPVGDVALSPRAPRVRAMMPLSMDVDGIDDAMGSAPYVLEGAEAIPIASTMGLRNLSLSSLVEQLGSAEGLLAGSKLSP